MGVCQKNFHYTSLGVSEGLTVGICEDIQSAACYKQGLPYIQGDKENEGGVKACNVLKGKDRTYLSRVMILHQ